MKIGIVSPATPVASLYPLALTRPADPRNSILLSTIIGGTVGSASGGILTDLTAAVQTRAFGGAAGNRSIAVGIFRKQQVVLGSPEEGNLLASCRIVWVGEIAPSPALSGRSEGIVSVASSATGVVDITVANPIHAGNCLPMAQLLTDVRGRGLIRVTLDADQAVFHVTTSTTGGVAQSGRSFDFQLWRLKIGAPG